ncbi:MAG TPA: HesA/MoeB/ThiF family protein [Thermoprotei archaeon]|nr:HesA/MoeB/ThiF family protein [TACK group archaeon]HEV51310.1 HesA/MoeB/ThiF family protein [Thermoprotei archaeon]
MYYGPDLLRFDRQLLVIGREAQLKLRDSRVAIVGMGGLGSNVAMQLAAMGVGHLTLVDFDEVELTNINRQPLYDESDVKKPKAIAASQKLMKINSKIEVVPIVGRFEQNTYRIENVDVIVDGLDSISARLLLNAFAVKLKIPYVFASVEGYYGNVSTILPGKTACLRCFMKSGRGDEKACAHGIYPPAVFMASTIESSETISIIVNGTSPLAGKLLVFDASSYVFDVTNLKRNPSCPVCGD